MSISQNDERSISRNVMWLNILAHLTENQNELNEICFGICLNSRYNLLESFDGYFYPNFTSKKLLYKHQISMINFQG